jgi:hypothetical protein
MADELAPRTCPACTREATDYELILRQAQFNHSLLRKDDPGYARETDVSTHCAIDAIRSILNAAKAFDRDTREMAIRFSHHQNYLLTLADASLRLLDSGDLDKAKEIISKLRRDIGESIAENRNRFTYEETLDYFMHLDELQSIIFFYAGVDSDETNTSV